MTGLLQVAAEALDAPAGLLNQLGVGGIGNAECGAKAERGALDDRDAFGLQQLSHEVLVGLEQLAAWRRLAHGSRTGRIHVERALRLRTMDALCLVQHRDAEVTALLEDLVVLRNEVLRS